MKALLWILGILSALFLTIFILKDDIRQKLLPNKIMVSTQGDITGTDIHIDWTSEAERDTLTIYEAGYQTDALFESRGLNYFLVYRDKQLIGQFDQFKKSATSPHTYHFTIKEKNDSLMLNLYIKGPDATR